MITSGQNGIKLEFEGYKLGYYVPWKLVLEF